LPVGGEDRERQEGRCSYTDNTADAAISHWAPPSGGISRLNLSDSALRASPDSQSAFAGAAERGAVFCATIARRAATRKVLATERIAATAGRASCAAVSGDGARLQPGWAGWLRRWASCGMLTKKLVARIPSNHNVGGEDVHES